MVDFPAFLETESGQFKAAAEATVAEWRAAKRIEKGWRRRLIWRAASFVRRKGSGNGNLTDMIEPPRSRSVPPDTGGTSWPRWRNPGARGDDDLRGV